MDQCRLLEDVEIAPLPSYFQQHLLLQNQALDSLIIMVRLLPSLPTLGVLVLAHLSVNYHPSNAIVSSIAASATDIEDISGTPDIEVISDFDPEMADFGISDFDPTIGDGGISDFDPTIGDGGISDFDPTIGDGGISDFDPTIGDGGISDFDPIGDGDISGDVPVAGLAAILAAPIFIALALLGATAAVGGTIALILALTLGGD